MSRTTAWFSKRKLFLVPDDPSASVLSLCTPIKPSGIDFKIVKPVSRENTIQELNEDLENLCKNFQNTLLSEPDPSETLNPNFFIRQSTSESASVSCNDILKLTAFRQKLEKNLPLLSALTLATGNLEKQFKKLGEESLRSSTCLQTPVVSDKLILKDCPLLPNVIVDKFFLNYVVLMSLLNDSSKRSVHPALKSYANIHRRILCTQLKLQTLNGNSEKMDVYEKKFKNILSKIQELNQQKQLLKVLQKVNISTVLESLKNYRLNEDRRFKVEELKSDCMLGPNFFFSEIQRILTIINFNLGDSR